ncbi:MAG: anthranilate synthase component II, partial [Opitutales bacterium]
AVRCAAVAAVAPRLIVLSPGPGGPAAAGRCAEVLAACAGRVPIFGVCLGMQVLATFAGGAVKRAREPMHGKLSAITHDGAGVFAGLPSPLQVTRYHSLVVEREGLPASLAITAETAEGEIMGVRDAARRLEGVQFHPEALLTEEGLRLIENSLRL